MTNNVCTYAFICKKSLQTFFQVSCQYGKIKFKVAVKGLPNKNMKNPNVKEDKKWG